MVGATPVKPTISGCSTPSAIPAATPASMALPPASRMRMAARLASGWPLETAASRPVTAGRWLFRLRWSFMSSPSGSQEDAALDRPAHPALGAGSEPHAADGAVVERGDGDAPFE